MFYHPRKSWSRPTTPGHLISDTCTGGFAGSTKGVVLFVEEAATLRETSLLLALMKTNSGKDITGIVMTGDEEQLRHHITTLQEDNNEFTQQLSHTVYHRLIGKRMMKKSCIVKGTVILSKPYRRTHILLRNA